MEVTTCSRTSKTKQPAFKDRLNLYINKMLNCDLLETLLRNLIIKILY